MKTLSDVRKQLKRIGFKVKTETLSWGRHATYENELGEKMPSIFSKETLAHWQPLIDFRKANQETLKAIGKAEGIIAL